jgi:hypothetical protein
MQKQNLSRKKKKSSKSTRKRSLIKFSFKSQKRQKTKYIFIIIMQKYHWQYTYIQKYLQGIFLQSPPLHHSVPVKMILDLAIKKN